MPFTEAAARREAATPSGAARMHRLGGLAMALLLLTWAWDVVRVANDLRHPEPAFAVQEDRPAYGLATPVLTEIGRHAIPVPGDKPSSHSSSIVAIPGASGRVDLLAFWFAGSRESGPDVEIVSSRFDGVTLEWSPPRISLNRERLAADLDFSVRRLGNPVAWVDASRKVHLFAVATGLGGWSASRVVHLVSEDEGITFEPERVLPLSPWFNTSAMVRAQPVALADGGALLPLYFEFGNKYPIAMRVSASGVPVAIVRMSHDVEALQPAIVPIDSHRAVALLRDPGETRTLKVVSTRDAGLSWADEGMTNLANPNSAVAAARLPGGTLLAAVNPSRTERSELAMAVSRSGRDWTVVQTIASGGEDDEFSYPQLLVQGDLVHLTYTDRRQRIAHRIYRIKAPQ